MTREEIDKVIDNGESVWCYYCSDKSIEEIYFSKNNKYDFKETNVLSGDKEIMLVINNDWYYPLEYLFKTKTEAEHYLHHANVTRTETLPFLTWEEFSKINIKDIEFTDKKLNLYNLSGFGKIKLYRNIDTADETLLLELEATEQNFYKAYDECVRLFRGDEE